jgi:hypothetical protein
MNLSTRFVAILSALAALNQANGDLVIGESYVAANDVEQHARIELDVALIDDQVAAAIAAKSGSEVIPYAAAKDTYENGNFSSKGGDPVVYRTLQGFSTGVKGKADGFGDNSLFPDIYTFVEYFSSDTYADDYVQDMLSGTGTASTGLDDAARDQYVVKTIQYQNVWMYVLYEMAAAISKCENGIDGSKNWDEAVAFYTGVESGPSNGYTSGKLLWTFANKRCGNVGACDADGLADTNKNAFKAFTTGLSAIQEENCPLAKVRYVEVRKQMQIAMLRGVIQYSFQKSAPGAGNSKNYAEAWAFSRAILPYLDKADSSKTAALVDAVKYEGSTTQPPTAAVDRSAATDSVFDAVFAALNSMCISCEELGTNVIPGAKQCTTDQSALQAGCDSLGFQLETEPEDEVDIGLVVGLGVASFILIIGVSVAMWYVNKKADAENKSSGSKVATASSV